MCDPKGKILTVTSSFTSLRFVNEQVPRDTPHLFASSHRSGGSIPTKAKLFAFSWITNKNGIHLRECSFLYS